MPRSVIYERFGGPEILEIRETEQPQAGPGEVRVRVTAAALNPVDWKIASSAEVSEAFGGTLPSGFGNDFAGVIDQVGDGVEEFSVGDRVFGGARGRAVADYVTVTPGQDALRPTPEGVDDVVASTLLIAGNTADAAISTIGVGEGDVLLVGGAAGGVGVFVVQLAQQLGARVIGTASPASFEFLRGLGVEPVEYGEGLADRVRKLAPDGVTAATDLHGTEVIETALELGVPAERISTITVANPPPGVRATGGGGASPGALEKIAGLIRSGDLVVPIEATYPVEQVREAVERQSTGHVKGKIVITMAE